MRVSLAVGFFLLAAKTGAWLLTGSAVIFSDAAESVVHVLAVAFAAYSVWLSHKPASLRSPFGYERIAFFSAGFEGLVIDLVALVIIWASVRKWLNGIVIEHIGAGLLITVATVIVNGILGLWLIRRGNAYQSLILVADGKHVLTDSFTSLGAVTGLLLVAATGWLPFDPLFAIAAALNIMWTGTTLIVKAVCGLMDINDPELERTLVTHIKGIAADLNVGFHAMQARDTGRRVLVNVHLLFPEATPIGAAHRTATAFESRLAAALGRPTEVTTHLEAIEDHSEVHSAKA